MRVTVERVDSFNLRNLLGHDCTEAHYAQHLDCLNSSSVIWLGRADGIEACAIGLIPIHILSDRAYLWMIHTRLCEQHPLLLIRWSRKVINEALSLYPHLVGLCRCDNDSGRRWLEWLGARFDGSMANGCFKFRIG